MKTSPTSAAVGFWAADFGDYALRTRAEVLMMRRFVVAADMGAQPLVVPIADRRHQPVHSKYTGGDTIGLDTWVDDVTAWASDQVTAVTTADAALGATSLSMDFTAPVRLLGGEHFAALHPTWSWRLYRVSRVLSGGLGTGDATTIQFRTPLREAIPSGTHLDFDMPRFTARVDGDISEVLEMLRHGKAQARFVEYDGPLP
jgi:hypothetical protein